MDQIGHNAACVRFERLRGGEAVAAYYKVVKENADVWKKFLFELK
jgi:hypothetical protein